MSQSFLDHPFDVSGLGSARLTEEREHLADLVIQVLFTDPGERVNLPEFGCGIRRLVFAGNNEALRAATQFLITQNLQRWLGDKIEVERAEVSSTAGAEEILQIEVVFKERSTGIRRQVTVRA